MDGAYDRGEYGGAFSAILAGFGGRAWKMYEGMMYDVRCMYEGKMYDVR